MHVRTLEGAVLNGRRFAAGAVLDLPEPEAKELLKAKMAEALDAKARPE